MLPILFLIKALVRVVLNYGIDHLLIRACFVDLHACHRRGPLALLETKTIRWFGTSDELLAAVDIVRLQGSCLNYFFAILKVSKQARLDV